MAGPPIYTECNITVYSQGKIKSITDPVVNEVPLTIFLNDTELVTLICSPGGFKELAAGFLASEGLVAEASDIKEITLREEEGLLWVKTGSSPPGLENFLKRNIASCCGKGRASLYFINDAGRLKPVHSTAKFSAERLLDLIGLLEAKSDTFRKTGGAHSAALADNTGLPVFYEDIGRHNAVDKVLGHAFLKKIASNNKCLLLSGRISSEILIKAVRCGVPLVLSRSAPTFLAVELAGKLGVTVAGFARGERMNIYSLPERIVT